MSETGHDKKNYLSKPDEESWSYFQTQSIIFHNCTLERIYHHEASFGSQENIIGPNSETLQDRYENSIKH